MKAFYSLYNKNLFQIHQNPAVKSICDYPLNNVSTELKPNEKELGVNIVLSNISPNGSKNAKLVEEAISVIQENKLTKIDNLVNRYRVAVDYVILNEDKIPVDHGINYKEIKAEDMAILFDVNPENNYEFSVGKKFVGSFNLMYRSATPFGIMCARENKYHILITRIMILQARTLDTDAIFDDRSLSGVSHKFYFTHEDINDKFLIIYDTKNEGFSFDPIMIPFKPREINININIQLGNYFTVADDTIITTELEKNNEDNTTIPPSDEPIEEPEPENPPPADVEDPVDTPIDEPTDEPSEGDNGNSGEGGNDVTDPGAEDPVTGDNTEDGSTENPDTPEKGTGEAETPTTSYVRCTDSDEGAKLVVTDEIDDEDYNADNMCKISEVSPYITDIQVGEYVVQVAVSDVSK